MMALFLNVMNVTDSPNHIKGNKMKFSCSYFTVVNLAIIGILIVIKYLTEQKFLILAGIVSNIPLFAIALLAAAALQTEIQATKDIKQQAYMLSLSNMAGLRNDCGFLALFTIYRYSMGFINDRNFYYRCSYWDSILFN